MKLTLAIALVAAAAAAQDTQPPVISLDLANYQFKAYHPTAKHVGVGCSVDKTLCRAARGTLKKGYSYVEKYSRSCPAGQSDITSCALPNAHAYDHQDGSLHVTKTIKLMNNDGKRCIPTKTNSFCVEPAVNYARRSEYAVEYDATDSAGNQAEKLIFTLVLNDLEAPSITPANGLPTKLESCDVDNLGQSQKDASSWVMPNTAIANDNIDGIVSNQMVITIKSPRGSKVSKTQGAAKKGKSLTIDTHVLGTWTVTYTATDNAGHFGTNGKNNENEYTREIKVQDTTAPSLYCKGKSCAYEPGRVSIAYRNKYAVNQVLTTKTVEGCCHECEQQQFRRQTGTIPANHPPACGFFSYDSKNKKCYLMAANLNLKPKGVVEAVKGWSTGYPIQCQVQNDHECGTPYTDAGARCIDLRDSFDPVSKSISDKLLLASSSAAQQPIVIKQVGLQTIQYNCADKQGLKAKQATRFVNVRDTQAPKITLIDSHTVETSAGVTPQKRIDSLVAGSRCVDTNNCDPNPKTVTSWHIGSCSGPTTNWDSKKKGTFAIKYVCKDHKGHKTTACRKVINQDKTVPVITLNNAKHGDIITVAAKPTGSFLDAGATCFDFIDGQINENLVIKGSNIKLNRPGTYKISYDCTDSAGNSANTLSKTVIVKDSECPRCVVNGKQTVHVEAGFTYTEKGATCTDKIGRVDGNNMVQTNLAAEAVGAVDANRPGTYTVTYKAKDGSNNFNDGSAGQISLGGGKTTCNGGNKLDKISVYQRVVVVEDTLKPVITLDYNNIPIHTGDSSDRGHNDVANLAGDPKHNPYLTAGKGRVTLMSRKFKQLMAEQTSSVNGWVIGAVASAVAGVALLGLSRRSPVVTSVPV